MSRRGSRRCELRLLDVRTSAEAIAALRESVLPALEAALTEHRDAIDPLLDGPTARVLDLVGADLAAETRRPRRVERFDC